MIVKKIANHHSRKNIDKNTSIKRIDSVTGFVFAEGQYIGRTMADIDRENKDIGRIFKKYPEDLCAIWIKDMISPPVKIWKINVFYPDGRKSVLNLQFMYQIQLDYNEEKFDGNDVLRFYESIIRWARTDMDFDPSIKAEGDNGVVIIPDCILSNLVSRYIQMTVYGKLLENYPEPIDLAVLTKRSLDQLNNDPVLLNYCMRIVDLKVELTAPE